MPKYTKAPAWVGKNLTLAVGRGDKRIEDGVLYNDSRLAKYVRLGFLVAVEDDKEPAQAPSKPAKVASPDSKAEKTVSKPAKKKAAAKTVSKKKYDGAKLGKRNKQVLMRLAKQEFGLTFGSNVKKPVIVDAILKAQG